MPGPVGILSSLQPDVKLTKTANSRGRADRIFCSFVIDVMQDASTLLVPSQRFQEEPIRAYQQCNNYNRPARPSAALFPIFHSETTETKHCGTLSPLPAPSASANNNNKNRNS